MKRLFTVLLPALILLAGITFFNSSAQSAVSVEVITPTPSYAQNSAPIAPSPTPKSTPTARQINVLLGESTQKMSEDKYLICVLAGEISPKSNIEALKAQAVAARTYLYNKILNGGCNKSDGDICADYKHCQAFKSVDDMRKGWGNSFDEYFNKISLAVTSTANEVVTFEQKPINALYHSSSANKTEDCVSVFGGNYPYLVSVKSPEAQSEDKSITFTKQEFLQKVNSSFDLSLTKIDIKIATRTKSGRVATVFLDDKQIKATALRSCLGLRSTDFTFTIDDKSITFFTFGYGHGVGMSQAGAKQMADDGKNYKQILTHYYLGTTIEKYYL